jgi:chemotaxis protein MotA
MNINYIIGLVGAFCVFLFGVVTKIDISNGVSVSVNPGNIINFIDPASIFIVIGCTVFIVVASFPGTMLKSVPKHIKIILNNKLFDPVSYIDQLVELAQIARKSGLLSLEEKANAQEDPFFKQAIMLIVDAYDPDKVRGILENDIEQMSARHDDVAGMYEKASSVAPAFGMVGTLVGLVNMLRSMNLEDGSSSLGADMGTALITTLYGCILAHMIFSPIASLLRYRDEEEVLCKRIIVEGVMSIQAGDNPKFLRERLLTYMSQQQRELAGEGGSGGGSSEAAE